MALLTYKAPVYLNYEAQQGVAAILTVLHCVANM